MSNTPTSNSSDLTRLEKRLNYSFRNTELLAQALTHKSHSSQNNERLEFLGDAVLGYVIAEVLFSGHPELHEDALTILRADLVRRETLADVATNLGLGAFLRLGAGERKSGGRQRSSILADAVEAIIGAVSLDGGTDAARELVEWLFAERLSDVRERRTLAVKDAKTQLQEILQGRSMPLPVYEVVSTGGSEHLRTFTVACQVESLALETTADGSSRRAAEKAAAEIMVERILELV